ncbi:MAG: hypothetical protein ACE5EL_00470, partial [Anaerolineae bacterium]
MATAAVLVWAGDVQFASAQPVPADEEAIMSNWIIVAQENDYLGEEYDRESLTFGTWAQMYEPSGDFYDGSAAAPFADDLVPAAGLWATTVYSGGLPIGAVIADGTDAWVTSGSDVAAGMDAMQGNERVLFVAMADGWWLID